MTDADLDALQADHEAHEDGAHWCYAGDIFYCSVCGVKAHRVLKDWHMDGSGHTVREYPTPDLMGMDYDQGFFDALRRVASGEIIP